MEQEVRDWLTSCCAGVAEAAGVAFRGLEEREAVVDTIFEHRGREHRYPVLHEWIEKRFDAWTGPLTAHLSGWRRRSEG